MAEKPTVICCGGPIREDIADLSEVEGDRCPNCGGACEQGFGLAGGGFGPYLYCDNCGRVVAKYDIPDDEAPARDGKEASK